MDIGLKEDNDVPKSATALKNWHLNKDDKELIIDLNENRVPQNLFGTTVTTGFDFYRELVKSSDFLKGITQRLVSIYFNGYSSNKQSEIVNKIVASNPTQFQDILLQIIFSKEFLYNATKVKSIEESGFNIMRKIDFYATL